MARSDASLPLIHRSAWKVNSANFGFKGFRELRTDGFSEIRWQTRAELLRLSPAQGGDRKPAG